MRCLHCGAEIADDSRFCPNCGADQQQAQAPQQEPQDPWQQPPQAPQEPQGSGSWQQPPPYTPPTGGAPGGNDIVLKVFAAVCAVLYGVTAVRGLIAIARSLFRYMFSSSMIILLPFNLLAVVLNVFMCLVLVMLALRRTPRNSDGLLALLGIGGGAIIVLRFVLLFLQLITNRYAFSQFLAAFARAAFAAVFVVAVVYLILRFVMGEFPLVGKNKDELLQEIRETLDALGQTAGEAAQGAKNSWDASQQARQAQQKAQQAQQQAAWQGQNYGQPGPYDQAPGQFVPPSNGYSYPVAHLKADRSLVAYILLSLLTCGLYSFYFLYALARDVNIACAGDGKQTAGLIKLLLLSFLTCGFYGWFWYYSLGNRLAANAPRYGLSFQENGTTVLLWAFLGSLLCGIGIFVAMHILIKNTNAICGAYNYQHGI